MRTGRTIGAMLCIALAAGVSVRSVSAALIAQYTFDSLTSGNTVAPDSSGNGNDATFFNPWPTTVAVTLSNDTPYGVGVPGDYSLSLTGDGTYGNVNGPAPGNLYNGGTNRFTMSAWVNPATVAGMGILTWGQWSSSPNEYAWLTTDGLNHLEGWFYDGTSWHIFASAASLPVGQWSQVAAGYYDGTMRVYLNGNLVASQYIGAALPTTLSGLEIGLPNQGFYGGSWNGLIDDVSFSNTAIPEPSVVSLLGLGGAWLWRQRRRQRAA